jgi:hypothetical protein
MAMAVELGKRQARVVALQREITDVVKVEDISRWQAPCPRMETTKVPETHVQMCRVGPEPNFSYFPAQKC